MFYFISFSLLLFFHLSIVNICPLVWPQKAIVGFCSCHRILYWWLALISMAAHWYRWHRKRVQTIYTRLTHSRQEHTRMDPLFVYCGGVEGISCIVAYYYRIAESSNYWTTLDGIDACNKGMNHDYTCCYIDTYSHTYTLTYIHTCKCKNICL